VTKVSMGVRLVSRHRTKCHVMPSLYAGSYAQVKLCSVRLPVAHHG